MNFSDLDLKNKNVLIIGPPASGKTTLAKKLATPDHLLIHTDDYMGLGYYDAMYSILDDIIESEKPTIVEGVQGYRLLRKGVEKNTYYPDIVIELKISDEKMEEIYRLERDPKKIRYLSSFNKMHEKILTDYQNMYNPKKPIWLYN